MINRPGYSLIIYPGRTRTKVTAFGLDDGGVISNATVSLDTGIDPCKTLAAALDELEGKLGVRFFEAYIAGFFGGNNSKILSSEISFKRAVKVTASDVRDMILKLPELANPLMQAVHLFPVSYDTDTDQNLKSPVGVSASRMGAKFFAIFSPKDRIQELHSRALGCYVEPKGLIDIMFAMNKVAGESLLINLGASATRVSLSTKNGIIYMSEISTGQEDLTRMIADRFGLNFTTAEQLKTGISSAIAGSDDQFNMIRGIPVADIKNIISDFLDSLGRRIIQGLPSEVPEKVILFGGGANIKGASDIFSEIFEREVRIANEGAAMQSIIRIMPARNEKTKRRGVRGVIQKLILFLTHKKCPVYPSAMVFSLDPATFHNFEAAGITTLHYDYMDGKYVERSWGGAGEVNYIKNNSNLDVSVHMMATDPGAKLGQFIGAGASSIILSTGSAHLARNLSAIRQAGRKCGLAINPEDEVEVILPIIRHLDKVVVMSVTPGKSGQKFMPQVLSKVKTLAGLRKKHKLKFEIIMDGGINPDTAADCWKAGADALVSGSYLAHAPDLKEAVQELMVTAKR
ncbi:MAG: ribulose-phosphate 3-epimerase [Alphaproteobacteria bacterium]|nr:ribulose-phosphate 3-epimerase [Alphaproteobacteria bacterium]